MTENTTQTQRVVLATPFELLRAASGNPITVSTVDGEEVVLRIPTLEEYKSAVERSHEWFAAHGLEVPEAPSDDAIRAAIKPLT
ncbi:hypothetical protein ACIBI0_38565 [Microbispora rosea]|uniref:hypothetical protein n=1 Tax=Microbispora rosea TaxID=58117 RepID=UPI0037B86183